MSVPDRKKMKKKKDEKLMNVVGEKERSQKYAHKEKEETARLCGPFQAQHLVPNS